MPPHDLLQADAQARRTALDVARSFIVQAPAGSGKTELLTQRYLALLAVVERPEALLAITFTRKAAAEMRNRILESLRTCADPAAELRDDTRTLARRALEADAQRGWGLLRNPNRLRVLTIDALNQSLARRLPVLSGLGAGLDVDEQGRDLHELAAQRLLAHLPSDDPLAAAAVGTLLEHLDNDVGKLIALVADMLARREAWLPVLPSGMALAEAEAAQVRALLEAGRALLVTDHLAALVRAFPSLLLGEIAACAQEAAAVLRAAGTTSPILHCAAGVPDASVEAVSHWQGLAEFVLTREGNPRQRFSKKEGVPARDSKHPGRERLKARLDDAMEQFATHPGLHELLHATRALPAPRYEDDEWKLLAALLLMLRLAAAELKSVFAQRRTADYPEFAAAAREALGPADEPTDTALALDARLRHILVDEFQDTSEAQVRLLESLTAGWQHDDGRTLFAVGDPMQSIYRFRNAEVGLFLDVRDRGLGSLRLEPLTLRVNFRSTRPIVEWVNRSFASVLPERDDVLRGAVQFAESVAAVGAAGEGGVTLHAFLRRSRVHEAQRVADIVAARHRDAPQVRIGVLVQSRGHLTEIVRELSRRGIRFQATDIDPLAARPAVLDLLALTRALAHPGDRAAWLGVLRAPWCGLRLRDCHALLGDDRHATAMRLLLDPGRRARIEDEARARLERCVPVLVQAIGERRRFGLCDAVERAWHALGGPATLQEPRELDEARAFLDTLGRLEATAPGAALDLARLTEALRDLYASSRPGPQTRVELLTIHKAKGLQFDTVIVPGLDRVGRSDPEPLLRWLEVPLQDGPRLVIAPINEVGVDAPDRLHSWLGRLERDKLQQEKRRLLYVAATRAERSLHLLGTCGVDQPDDGSPPEVRAPDRRSALGLLWDLPWIRAAFDARLADVASIAGEEAPVVQRDPILLRLPDGWRFPALPQGPRIESRELARSEAGPVIQFDWASETARHVGTVVHRELQRLTRTEAALPDAAAPVDALLQRFATELAELGVPEAGRPAAAGHVLAALRRTLGDERGRWLLQATHHDAQSELALTGLVGNDVVSVVIDRTFVDASGTRWIVDYKTSSHAGAGLDEFLNRERERYRPQLERYALLLRAGQETPIRLGLYFPLLSAWREWEAGSIADRAG